MPIGARAPTCRKRSAWHPAWAAAADRCVTATRWRRSASAAQAYVPLVFSPGEAYQFDWSHEYVVLAGVAMAPPTYLLGVLAHEGSHALAAEAFGVVNLLGWSTP